MRPIVGPLACGWKRRADSDYETGGKVMMGWETQGRLVYLEEGTTQVPSGEIRPEGNNYENKIGHIIEGKR